MISSRSSSITAPARESKAQNRQQKSSHHSTSKDDILQPGSSGDYSVPSDFTICTSRSTDRTQPPPGSKMRSTSSRRQSRSFPQTAQVQRWAGLTRSVCNWDGLRRDPELWVQDGDCLVHLYEQGASRRGPSFRVPLRALRQKTCDAMLDKCLAQIIPDNSLDSREALQVRSFSNLLGGSATVELFIPAPGHISREEAFDWHVTTRNFFAYILGQPLVGRHMGQAFVDLVERLEVFRSRQVNNHQDFLVYAETQGYRDLVECTDYALANMYYAERFKLKDVWIDAFAHCVGMGDSISLSPEYMPISRLTKALITRAHLEVDLHLDRVKRALATFLSQDFSPTHLGLSHGARNHLNRFQRFLHDFYAEKFGYWPPPTNASSFPKALYKSMFYDFQNLYELLVDTQSYNDIASQTLASGGICVLQNVDYFDKRNKFPAQQHPLPLLPQEAESQKLMRSLSSASQHKKTWDVGAALLMATNRINANVANSKIVQTYLEFERTNATSSALREDKISMGDARKIRWLLIYGTLQYLTSALRAPSAVRDTESPDYPLCCILAGPSTWISSTPAATPSVRTPSNIPGLVDDYFGSIKSCSIEPDCHREDYFSTEAPGRCGNGMSTPISGSLPVRQSSTRSFGPLASLSRRVSRRNSLVLKPASHCAIIVHGYGDGLNAATTQDLYLQNQSNTKSAYFHDSKIPGDDIEKKACSDAQALRLSSGKAVVTDGEPRGHTRNRTPLLHTFQLDQMIAPLNPKTIDSMSRSDSTSSGGSSVWTDRYSAASSKSSADGDGNHIYKTSTADHSGLLGGLVSVDGTRVSLDTPRDDITNISATQRDLHPLLRKRFTNQDGFQFDFSSHEEEAVNSIAETTGSVGVALSAPPSPSLHALSTPQITRSRSTMTIPSTKNTNGADDTAVKTLAAKATTWRKKSRGSEILAGFPTELRDRYINAIKRVENSSHNMFQYGDLGNGSNSHSQPPTVTKTSHATKTSSSLRHRFWHDYEKQEKRTSFIWRR
ncbi:hypothetical protein BDU57DRAFT_541253 [Ampelomyces quisqualis]|uniref:DUF8004 domain-containing protein n=1 Tax=Ampelomyces quisqualis TaxID=50730 RepID=A0A6A5QET0_AMPQU|nr:hypothetical protein BDU57DRAFT_541253 [Ampelomyces quisqualis]